MSDFNLRKIDSEADAYESRRLFTSLPLISRLRQFISQLVDIFRWGAPVHSPVFTTKLGGTFVTNLKCRSCSVEVLG